MYRYCFGKAADGLERSVEGEDECERNPHCLKQKQVLISRLDMLTLNQPPLTQHISVPRDMSQLSCEAYTAGVVEGVLDGLNIVS